VKGKGGTEGGPEGVEKRREVEVKERSLYIRRKKAKKDGQNSGVFADEGKTCSTDVGYQNVKGPRLFRSCIVKNSKGKKQSRGENGRQKWRDFRKKNWKSDHSRKGTGRKGWNRGDAVKRGADPGG